MQSDKPSPAMPEAALPHRVGGAAARIVPAGGDAAGVGTGRAPLADRLADRVAATGGSWGFIAAFCALLAAWVLGNSLFLAERAFDPYPYIFLNLILSMLAAVQAPIIMMSQNRQTALDRARAVLDYEVNLRAELEIQALHEKLDAFSAKAFKAAQRSARVTRASAVLRPMEAVTMVPQPRSPAVAHARFPRRVFLGRLRHAGEPRFCNRPVWPAPPPPDGGDDLRRLSNAQSALAALPSPRGRTALGRPTARPQADPHRSITMTRRNRGRAIAILTTALLLSAAVPDAWAQPAPVPVEVAEVRPADVPFTLQGIGTVQAFNTVTVRAQVDGALQQVRFTEGQAVRAGDALAQIDPRTYQATLDQAQAKKAQDEAQLRNAELDLQRYADLARSDFASRQQLATQQATVAGLQAQVQGDQAAIENARTQLGYTTLASPIDGITGMRLVDQGNLVRAADATGIVVITQVRPISVVFTLPAESLAEIRQAMAAGPLHATVLGRQSGKPLGEGTLLLVNNQIDTATGQLRLKATLPNEDGALWPGQFVTVQLLLRLDRGIPTVPTGALQRGPEGYWVYVVNPDQTVAAQPVQVRRFGGGSAVVEGGPAPGTTVVSAGQYRLSPGARITVAQAQPAAPGGGGTP